MLSRNIKPLAATSTTQLTLDFEPGLCDTYRSLRDVVAAGVYRRGLNNVAIDLDKAPGNLSVEISADPSRKFSVESLETYIEKTGDHAPIYYLCEKFLQEKTPAGDTAMAAQGFAMLGEAVALLKRAGVSV